MIVFRNLAVLLGALALAAIPSACASGQDQAATEPTVEEILANHVEAIGGEDAIESIQNIRVRPEITEPEFTLQGEYRATRDGRMRIDVYADGNRVFSEGIDSEGAWQQGGEGAEITDIDGVPASALERGIDFNIFGLHDLAARGHSVALHGRETVDGTSYYVIALTMADEFQRYYYINPINWLIERVRETSALHPDLDPEERPAETVESDFQEICGVLRPMRMRKIDLESGEEIQRTRVHYAECNVSDDVLRLPRAAEQSPPE